MRSVLQVLIDAMRVLIGERGLEVWTLVAAVAVRSRRFLSHGLLEADVLWASWRAS